MSESFLSIVLLLMCSLFPLIVNAQERIPEPDEIILRYIPEKYDQFNDTADNIDARIQRIQILLHQSQRIGQSDLVIEAQHLVDQTNTRPGLLTSSQQSALTFIQAELLQKQHLFKKAKVLIEDISFSSPYYSAGQLLLARAASIRPDIDSNYLNSKRYCTNIIQTLGPDVSLLCLLDIQLSQSEITEKTLLKNIQQLKSMPIQPINSTLEPTVLATWKNRLISIAYLRLNQPDMALHWIQLNSKTQNLYDILLMLDIAFEDQSADTSRRNILLKRLYEEYTQEYAVNTIEMSLLLRLARIEKTLDYRPIIQRRVESLMSLQHERLDMIHKADIAYFYLFIHMNHKKALYWAKKNMAESRDYTDQYLMKLARNNRG